MDFLGEDHLQKNLYLLNNTFNAVTGPVLELSGVFNLVVEGNTFTSGSPTGPLITIRYSENIIMTNNPDQGRIEISPSFINADNSNTIKKTNYAVLKPDDFKKNNVELVDGLPLIFGYTAWWDNNYKASPEPFRSDAKAKKQLDDALCVANGLEGYANTNKNYYFKIQLRNEPIEQLTAISLRTN